MNKLDVVVVGKAAKQKSDFECELCDSSFKSSRGLRAHEGCAHKANKGSPIAQLDGQSEKLEDNQDTRSSGDEDIESRDNEEHSYDVCDFVAKTRFVTSSSMILSPMMTMKYMMKNLNSLIKL